jgi:hypothetical protein
MNEPLTAWDQFVLRHRRPSNLVLHFISFFCFFGGPVLALLLWNPWYLVLFFASGLVGAAGHWISGDGGVNLRETTSSPQVVKFNTIMVYKVLSGSYRADIERALAKANA